VGRCRRFERFTDRARRVLVFAQEEARLLNHSYIGTEHILLGLIHEGEGVAAQALSRLGFTLEDVQERVEETVGLSRCPSVRRHFPLARKRCSNCERPCSLATTTSAQSTCSWAWSAKGKESPARFL
jgi:ATP-dependent Clp protease ATP-binding subunit ClpA